MISVRTSQGCDACSSYFNSTVYSSLRGSSFLSPPHCITVLLLLPLCGVDWTAMYSATEFPDVGRVIDHALAGSGPSTPGTGTSSRRKIHYSSSDMSTHMARQGSNFGLPIALQLTLLMKGGIGLARVRQWEAVNDGATICHAQLHHHRNTTGALSLSLPLSLSLTNSATFWFTHSPCHSPHPLPLSHFLSVSRFWC